MALPSAIRRHDYDPTQDGADCASCVLLQADGPVRSEFNNASWAFAAESPGSREVFDGRPLTGKSGIELQQALESLGLQRGQFDYLNRMSCRPPADRLASLLLRIARVNKQRTAVNKERKKDARARGRPHDCDVLPMRPTPMECCEPRFSAEVEPYEGLIPLGTTAARGVLPGVNTGILNIRGTLFEVPRPDGRIVKVLPTVHPAFVLREPRWRRTFRRDIDRAVRWFNDELHWIEPQVIYQPHPRELEAFLRHPGVRFWPFDVETRMSDRLKKWERPGDLDLRCIGIAQEGALPEQGHSVVVVPILSIDGETRFYHGDMLAEILRLLRWFLEDVRFRKVGHNAGNFDRCNILGQLGFEVNGLCDTMLVHCLADSEMPHSLGFVGSYYTDVHAWKNAHTATQAKTDAELHKYNAIDCVVNGRVFDPLVVDMRARQQHGILPLMHEMQRVCVGLEQTGLYVYQENRAAHHKRLQADAVRFIEAARKTLTEMDLDRVVATMTPEERRAGFQVVPSGRAAHDASEDTSDPLDMLMEGANDDVDPDEMAHVLGVSGGAKVFNPGSHPQVRRILFDELGLNVPSVLGQKDAYTSGGEISTGGAVLRALLASPHTEPKAKRLIRLILLYRESVKAFGTYVWPYDRSNPACVIDPRDGRAHASWRNHVAVTTRLASSPNHQNIPHELRDLFGPAAGFLFAYADFDQIEHRVAVGRWGGDRFKEAYALGQDIHQITMHLIWGERIWTWDGQPKDRWKKAGIGGTFSDRRDLGKRVLYGCMYGAEAKTLHRVITSETDERGRLRYGNLTERQVALMRRRLLDNWPELPLGWEKEVRFYRAHGYVEEPVTGRRRYLAEETLNELVNYPIQASASGIVNKATLRLVAEYPFFSARGPGLVNHMHDAMTLEVLTKYAEQAAHDIGEILTCVDPAYPDITFSAVGKVKQRLAA